VFQRGDAQGLPDHGRATPLSGCSIFELILCVQSASDSVRRGAAGWHRVSIRATRCVALLDRRNQPGGRVGRAFSASPYRDPRARASDFRVSIRRKLRAYSTTTGGLLDRRCCLDTRHAVRGATRPAVPGYSTGGGLLDGRRGRTTGQRLRLVDRLQVRTHLCVLCVSVVT
jgi:hypothetical protein